MEFSTEAKRKPSTPGLPRKAIELREGKKITIKSKEWDEFCDLAKVGEASNEWRCVFANGYVTIEDMTAQR